MPQTKATVLVLGAGLVCPPGVEYLCSHGFKVIVASRTLAAAEKITRKCENAEARELDIEKPSGVALLEELVPQVDAVLSLLPYIYHAVAAECALKNNKHFFTTSYVSDAMRKVVEQNKDAAVCILNECGVDPGTDHMSAKRIIDSVHQKGGKIVSFTSYCGGLPAPDANDNPFGYKLSWAPRGVLLASRNSATFLKNGELVTIPGEVLFDNYSVEEIPSLGKFEAYPNRNSTQYIEIYNIPETKTIIRGTYRNIGWCPTIKKLAELGYLSLDPQDFNGLTYAQATSRLLSVDLNSTTENLVSAAAQKLGIAADDFRIKNMEWLGLFGNNKIPANTATLLDVLCSLCVEKLQYKPGERDLLLMKHTFIAEYSDRRETITTTLIDYGIPNGHSSMSRTVTLPVAIAIRLVLEGKIKLTGLQMPVIPEWYNPILDELETFGIKFHDEVVAVEKI